MKKKFVKKGCGFGFPSYVIISRLQLIFSCYAIRNNTYEVASLESYNNFVLLLLSTYTYRYIIYSIQKISTTLGFYYYCTVGFTKIVFFVENSCQNCANLVMDKSVVTIFTI